MSVPYTRWRTDHVGRTFGGFLLSKRAIVSMDPFRDPTAETPKALTSRFLNRKPHQFAEVRLRLLLKGRFHVFRHQ